MANSEILTEENGAEGFFAKVWFVLRKSVRMKHPEPSQHGTIITLGPESTGAGAIGQTQPEARGEGGLEVWSIEASSQDTAGQTRVKSRLGRGWFVSEESPLVGLVFQPLPISGIFKWV